MIKKIWRLLGVYCLLFIPCSTAALSTEIPLRILCWQGYAQPYVVEFQRLIKRKYGIDITVQVSHVSSPADFWKLSRAKKVDLISPAHNLLKSNKWNYIQGKIALPLNLENIPNYRYLLQFLRTNSFVAEGEEVFGIPYAMGPYGLAYNADKVSAPDSWGVLWQEHAKKRFTLSKDYPDCNIYITALALGATYDELYDYDKLISHISKRKLERGVKQLIENAASFWVGTADYTEFSQLTYAATWGYAVAQANLHGGNWKMAYPEEGTTMWVDHWVITHSLKGQPLKKQLAEEWINYCLSNEVQLGVLRNWGVSPVVTNINDRLTPVEREIYKLGNNEYWKTLSLWQTQSTRTHNAYKNLWERRSQ